MAAKVLEDKTKEDCHTINVNLSNEIRNIQLNNDTNTDYLNIPWLSNFESPFHWHNKLPRASCSEVTIQRYIERLEEIKEDEEEFSLHRYSVLLNLVIGCFILKNKEQVKERVKELKSDIKRNSENKDPQYERLKIILAHVISTTEAYVLALDGQEEQSKKMAQTIVPINQMSTSNKAGLYAIKGAFFGSSRYDDAENVAVDAIRKALALEPENHEWLYLLSVVLRQQRKEIPFNHNVPREELVLLERAVKQHKSSKYLLYLAQVYRECATQAHYQNQKEPNYYTSGLHKNIKHMQFEALRYYKEALQLSPDHAANLRKIGYGIMHLPPYLADYDLALNCLLKSLEICSNSYILHVIGTFYHRYGNNNKKALEYFTKSNSFHGLSDTIRIKYSENPDYDPCEDIEKGLQKEIKTKNRVALLTQRAGYYLFIKRDFLRSIDSFNQAISEDKDSIHLTVFKSCFLRLYDAINLYHYMANECRLYMQEEDKDVNMRKVISLFNTITKMYPELGKIDPDPFLVSKLCDLSQKNRMRDQKIRDRNIKGKSQDIFQGGRQGGFQPRGSSGRGGSSDNCENWRGRNRFSNNEQACASTASSEKERSGRFDRNFRGRGEYPSRGKENDQHANDDFSWRKKQ